MKYTLLAIFLAFAVYGNAQTVNTGSGNTIPGYSRDGVPAFKQHNILLNQARYAPRPAAKTTLGSGPVYDTTRWNHRVDSTWNAGYTTSQYLYVLNTWWNTITTQYPCFVHLPAYNWDSIVSAMRTEISAGVSEGKFAAMINHLLSLVNDGHTNFYDYYVNYPYSVYPGLPLFRGESGMLGACITTLDDTVAMVYDAYPSHPLGLVPGDIILGYNGYPWTQLLQTIFRYQLPNSVYKGSTDSATMHRYIQAAGENWYLFDTINIKKCNGAIVNLPTSLMQGQFYQAFCTEQMAVPGVSKPNYNDYYNYHKDITYGKLTGTNIGYVYMYDCEDTTHKLYNAFKTLIEDSLVQGLILDIRTNFGGGFNSYWDAYQYLAAAGTSWVGYGQRSSPTDRLAMYIDGPTSWYDIYDMDPSYFAHPVAILCGPNAVSAGDFLPVMFKHDPHVKLFGKSTAGAYGNLTRITLPLSYIGSMQQTNFFQASDTSLYLSHTMFPVDVPAWFNKDSVCAGSDNVVSTAVQWINQVLAVDNITGSLPTIKVFPNPTSDLLTVDLDNIANEKVIMQIFDITGRILNSKIIENSTIHSMNIFNMAGYPPGVYMVKVTTYKKQVIREITKL